MASIQQAVNKLDPFANYMAKSNALDVQANADKSALDVKEQAQLSPVYERQQQLQKQYSTESKASETEGMKAAQMESDVAKWGEANAPKQHELPDFKPEKINQQDLQAFGAIITAFALIGGRHTLNPAVAAGNALAGAIEGYSTGNKIKFEEDFKVYKTNFDKAVRNSEMELQNYKTIMETKGKGVAAQSRLAEIHARAAGDTIAQNTFASQDITKIEKYFQNKTKEIDNVKKEEEHKLEFALTAYDRLQHEKEMTRQHADSLAWQKEKFGETMQLRTDAFLLRKEVAFGKPGMAQAHAMTYIIGRNPGADGAAKIATSANYIEALNKMEKAVEKNPEITGVRMQVYTAINKYLPADPTVIIEQKDVDAAFAQAQAKGELMSQEAFDKTYKAAGKKTTINAKSDAAVIIQKEAMDAVFLGASSKYGANRVPVSEFRAVQNVLAPQNMTPSAFHQVAENEKEVTIKKLHGIVTPQEFDKIYNYYQQEAPSDLYQGSHDIAPTNDKGWVLYEDASGVKAYVNPKNPTEFEEVK